MYPNDSSFVGENLIQYRVKESKKVMQIDLQPPMKITRIIQNGKNQTFKNDGNIWLVELSEIQKKGEVNNLLIELIDHSYDLVVQGMSKKQQKEYGFSF